MRTSELKVGDRVLVSESFGWQEKRHRPATVTRITPSGQTTVMVDAYPPHRTVAYERKFKPNGWQMGHDNYRGNKIVEFDASVLESELRRDRMDHMRRTLEDYNLWRSKLSDVSVTAVWAIVEPELHEIAARKGA
jgi:hypothetical protein